MKQNRIVEREKKQWKMPFCRTVRETGYYYVEAETEREARKMLDDGEYDGDDCDDRDIIDEEFEDIYTDD